MILSPMRILCGASDWSSAWASVLHGDELDAHHLGPDHPVDGVAAAPADPDDADQREVLGIGPQRHRAVSLLGEKAVHGVGRPDWPAVLPDGLTSPLALGRVYPAPDRR